MPLYTFQRLSKFYYALLRSQLPLDNTTHYFLPVPKTLFSQKLFHQFFHSPHSTYASRLGCALDLPLTTNSCIKFAPVVPADTWRTGFTPKIRGHKNTSFLFLFTARSLNIHSFSCTLTSFANFPVWESHKKNKHPPNSIFIASLCIYLHIHF